ncbi:tRNA(Ile)-lysidine synthase [Belliella buryatensis]|uniref:tRNA(Ile)-lysidine synthase n=1 Tax=Belliella buryatensis TaxID=1500549 RepID=A0A239B8J7_9BACT|nr:tRNA lysidine(34) synthetase TilS [Belliella buryatensis]SNS04226.1 tRNA(Ile)-lysidine synthase [Belliella buryatensis]
MVEHFIQHIRTKNLFDLEKRYLLAISGGLDSTCLGHLLKASGVKFALVHYNFGLRGGESDEDEAFVKQMADLWEVSIYTQKATPREFDQTGKSIQMIARELRYAWFESILETKTYAGVVVAHHLEDQLETIFLNLLRGTGIEGMYGMAEKRDYLIRPLLPFKKSDLQNYMVSQRLPWRIDSSNEKNIYKRNFIRNEVFPLIQSAFPDAVTTLEGSFQRIKDTGKAFFHLYTLWRLEHVVEDGGFQYLPIKALENLPGKHSMLYYWLRDSGFGMAEVEEVFVALDQGESGKVFFSGKYVLNVDREYLILGEQDFAQPEIKIDKTAISLVLNTSKYDILHLQAPSELDKSTDNAMLDLGKLEFPLSVRNWQIGDRLMPLGMKQNKKVSDLLIDLKVPVIHKKGVKVLCSGEEIVWVIGYRVSELFKVDVNTKAILYFKKR